MLCSYKHAHPDIFQNFPVRLLVTVRSAYIKNNYTKQDSFIHIYHKDLPYLGYFLKKDESSSIPLRGGYYL